MNACGVQNENESCSPESRHTLPHPEPDGGLIHGVATFLILPVEIRLALEEAMQVELLAGFTPCPCTPVNETSTPVGGRHREVVHCNDVAMLVFLRVMPYVPVGLGIVSTL
jgi:hypothetical protein